MKIQATNFLLRKYSKIISSHTIEEFVEHISAYNETQLRNGYSSFSKKLVLRNFTDAKVGTMGITLENLPYLKSDYVSRKPGDELAVLTRWFELPYKHLVPTCEYLHIVLYTREQLLEEYNSRDNDYEFELDDDTDFGIVTILRQQSPEDEPMNPMTIMRNYMDISFGGSGIEPPKKPCGECTDEEYEQYKSDLKQMQDTYQESVDFWSRNAIVK